MIHILISACLIGENCKWDGTNNRNQGVLEFMKKMEGKAEFHPVCPEQLGGLPTPRAASEIHMPDEAVINTEGEDVTGEFLPADRMGFMMGAFRISCVREWGRRRRCWPGMG